MQEAYRISVPEKIATFTISGSRWAWSEKFFAPLLQANRQVTRYESVASYYGEPHLINIAHEGETPLWHALPRLLWPILFVCATPTEALEIRAILVEQLKQIDISSEPPHEVSELHSGFRERFNQRVQAEGKHVYRLPHGESYGHVILDIEPDSALDEVVFESRVDERTIPKAFLPTIASAFREAVFRGGPKGYPLSGFRATLIGGSFHPVDSNAHGYRSATLLALLDAFHRSDLQLVDVQP